MTMIDAAYCQQRAIVERARAKTATDPIAARLHAELAERYEKMATGEIDGLQIVKQGSDEPSA